MMYDAAVAIGFAPRTSLSQKSNLRDRNGLLGHQTARLAAAGRIVNTLAYGFDRKSGLPVSKSTAPRRARERLSTCH
jgi:hypothetical protein